MPDNVSPAGAIALLQALRQGDSPGERMRRIELHLKLEEQWLYPALQRDARLPWVPPALLQLELLRDITHAWGQAAPDARASLLALLERAAQAHFALVDALLVSQAERSDVDWRKLQQDMQAMLARWRDEVRTSGDIEDEEADPVGRPPR